MSSATRFVEKAKSKRIRLGDLRPDPNNRELKEPHIKRLMSEFDFGKWTPPVVRENGDKPIVLDGHHHIEAACRLPQVGPDKQVICYVQPAPESETRIGEMRVGITSVIPHTATERFLERLRAGEESAVGAAKVIGDSAWEGISTFQSNGKIHTPKAVEAVYKSGGADAALFALEAPRLVWGAKPRIVASEMLRAFGRFHVDFPGVPAQTLADKLKLDAPDGAAFLGAVKQRAKAMGVSTHVAVYEKLIDAYNKGRRSGRLGKA